MNVFNVIIALLLATILTLVFAFAFRTRGPWNSPWAFFIVLLLAIVAAGVWLIPAGPRWNDVAWVPLVITGVLFALILAAATYSKPRRDELNTNEVRDVKEEIPKSTVATTAAFGMFFWLLLISLIAIIAIGLTY